MERWDDLQAGGLGIFQDDSLPGFTEDAVELVHFLRLQRGRPVIDLGCGNGIISILGAFYTGADFTGIDISEPQLELAKRSAERNGQRISFCSCSFSEAPTRFGHGSFDAAVCNPPYFAPLPGTSDPRALARHESADSFQSLYRSAFLLLKNGGRFFLCFPADQLAEQMHLLRAARLTPKRLGLLCPAGADVPRLALAECKKDGAPGCSVTILRPGRWEE